MPDVVDGGKGGCLQLVVWDVACVDGAGAETTYIYRQERSCTVTTTKKNTTYFCPYRVNAVKTFTNKQKFVFEEGGAGRPSMPVPEPGTTNRKHFFHDGERKESAVSVAPFTILTVYETIFKRRNQLPFALYRWRAPRNNRAA